MKLKYILIVILCLNLFFPQLLFAQNAQHPESGATQKKLTLDRAVMCEDIKDFAPQNPAVVFSIKIGKVCCYTSFDPVPKKTFIYHKWFHRDSLSTNKRLYLQPPRWATFSTIQLRETDIGPWRVEISDQNGKLLYILRFSITD
ncbi:MAG: DUF2914 domain-containing protein [Desulfobacterales bacterium]|jgi:hypothetical protein|nr:DUF2914 domain-containing protein [Desulfobacterales bacterium]